MLPLEKLQEKVLVRLVDDDEDVREGLSLMLMTKGWRVAAYECAQVFLVNDRPSEPGCVVLDMRMPGMSGMELQQQMTELSIDLPIIFLTGHADVDTAVAGLKKGAMDFLQKPVSNEKLLEAITEASRLCLTRRSGMMTPKELVKIIGEMSEREKEITKLLSDGLSNAAIAERLGLSHRTVQGHRNNIYRKLRVHSVDEFMQQIDELRL